MLLYTDLPAIKYKNVVESAPEMGTVTFPFRHAVMETGLLANVSPSPVNESCNRTLSEMAVIVSCSNLSNDMEYTVTLRGTLLVEEASLPFSFSDLLNRMSSPSQPSITGLWLKDCVDMYCTLVLIAK